MLMKRYIFKIIAILLAGAVINIAVAWGCAAWATEFGVDYVHLALLQTDSQGRKLFPPPSPIYEGAGWPLRSIVSRPWHAIDPISPGFAINTLFYSAVLWMLFAVPVGMRRRLRKKRGQCAACGYSLRNITSDKCPECGAAVTMRSSQ